MVPVELVATAEQEERGKEGLPVAAEVQMLPWEQVALAM